MKPSFLKILSSLKRAYLDTNVLIYHLEDIEPYAEITQAILENVIAKKFTGHTSVLGIMELNVGLYQQGKTEKVVAQTALVSQIPNFFIHPVDLAIADKAAQIRAQLRFKTPDAIHAATFLTAQCDAFIGNDKAFTKFKTQYIHLDDYC